MPGRKRERFPGSGKRRLSSDARIIIALLKKQPQSKDELCKAAGVSKSAFYRLRPLLADSGIVKEVEGGYALWTFSEVEKTVEDALFRLIGEGFHITVEDLTNEVGKPWLEIETVTYAVLKKYKLQIKTVHGQRFIDGWYGRKDLYR
jgi:DNA-binding IscR family transcriptional regulator